MAKPTLTPAERDSALWKKIEAHYEAHILTLRTMLEGDRTPDVTAKLRGRIAEVKNLLALASDTPDPVQEADG